MHEVSVRLTAFAKATASRAEAFAEAEAGRYDRPKSRTPSHYDISNMRGGTLALLTISLSMAWSCGGNRETPAERATAGTPVVEGDWFTDAAEASGLHFEHFNGHVASASNALSTLKPRVVGLGSIDRRRALRAWPRPSVSPADLMIA